MNLTDALSKIGHRIALGTLTRDQASAQYENLRNQVFAHEHANSEDCENLLEEIDLHMQVWLDGCCTECDTDAHTR